MAMNQQKIRMAQIIFKTKLPKTSNKIICGNLKIKFSDFLLTLNRDLEIPWPHTKLPDFSDLELINLIFPAFSLTVAALCKQNRKSIFSLETGNAWKRTGNLLQTSLPLFERSIFRASSRFASQTRQSCHLHSRRAAEFGHRHWHFALDSQVPQLFSWLSGWWLDLPTNGFQAHPTNKKSFGFFL